MIRNMKALGLAIVAVAAMSVAAASVAQASEFHATVAQKAVITGHQHVQNKFQITSGAAGPSVICSQATLEGTVEQQNPGQQVTFQHATLTPTYSGCQAFGVAATVQPHGCKYTITGTGTPALTADVDVVGCTPGKGGITVQTAICQIIVPEQNGLQHLVFKNIAGTPHTVTAEVTISSITYKLAGVGCGHATGVHTTDGAYIGGFHIQAYEDNKLPDQVTKHGHQYNELTHGEPVGLLAT